MEAKTLAPNFWVEAIKCPSYIQNRVPNKQLYGITPFKSWSGHKPDVTNFKFFGSKAWGLEFQLKTERLCNPKDKSVYFLGTLNIQNCTS